MKDCVTVYFENAVDSIDAKALAKEGNSLSILT